MNKLNSKYFNTALLMDEALLDLLEHKDYEFITVKEICENAGVNRSTFYLHYQTMNDLLSETMEMINNRFKETFNNEEVNPFTSDKTKLLLLNDNYIIPYLNYIKNNIKIYKLIHNKPELFNNKKAYTKLYKDLFSIILDRYGVVDDEKEYVFSFYTAGLVSIVEKWVENDCIEDVYKISNIMKKLILNNYEY